MTTPFPKYWILLFCWIGIILLDISPLLAQSYWVSFGDSTTLQGVFPRDSTLRETQRTWRFSRDMITRFGIGQSHWLNLSLKLDSQSLHSPDSFFVRCLEIDSGSWPNCPDSIWQYQGAWNYQTPGWYRIPLSSPFYCSGNREVMLVCKWKRNTVQSPDLFLRGGNSFETSRCYSGACPVQYFNQENFLPCIQAEALGDSIPCPNRIRETHADTLPFPEAIRLKWTKPSGPVSGYRISWDTIRGGIQISNLIHPCDTQLVLPTLRGLQTLRFRIQPIGRNGLIPNCPLDSGITSISTCFPRILYPQGNYIQQYYIESYNSPINTSCNPGFINRDTLRLRAGSQLTAGIRKGTCVGNYPVFLTLWGDWNGNGQWDLPQELIYQSGQIAAGTDSLRFRINLPNTIISGWKRIRWILKEGDSVSAPCNPFNYGHYIDQMTYIEGLQPPNCPDSLRYPLPFSTGLCPDIKGFNWSPPSSGNYTRQRLQVWNQQGIRLDTFLSQGIDTFTWRNWSPGNWQWKVLPEGPGGVAVGCRVYQYTCDTLSCLPLACPNGIVYPNGDTVYSAGVRLTWPGPGLGHAQSWRVSLDTLTPPIALASSWLSPNSGGQVISNLFPSKSYYWRIQGMDREGNLAYCPNTYPFHTTSGPCTPAYSIGNLQGDYLSWVEVNGQGRTSGPISPGSFERINGVFANVVSGQRTQLSLSPGLYPAGNGLSVWLDYNKDNQFASHEKLLDTLWNQAAPNRLRASSLIPVCLDTGFYWLRVKLGYGAFPGNPCQTVVYGETEDYRIQMLGYGNQTPTCSRLLFPIQAQREVNPQRICLRWALPDSGSCPQYFRIYVGTDYPPHNILSGHRITRNDSFVLNSLGTGQRIYWQVLPENISGTPNNCEIRYFETCPEVLTPLRIQSGITRRQRFTVSWDSFSGGVEIWASRDSIGNQLLPGYPMGIRNGGNSYTLDVPSGTDTIYYKARKYTNCDTGSWSLCTRIVLPVSPSRPVGLGIDQVTCRSFRISWRSTPTALNYRIDISADSLFRSFLTSYHNRYVQDTLLLVSGLSPSGRYFTRIIAENVCGVSPYSNVTAQSLLPNVWTGVRPEWEFSGNWCGLCVPDSTQDVVIPRSTVFQPEIQRNARCRNLQLDSGACLGWRGRDTLALFGDRTGNGKIQAGLGTIITCGNRRLSWQKGDTLNNLGVRSPWGVSLDMTDTLVIKGWYDPGIGPLLTNNKLVIWADSIGGVGIGQESGPLGQTIGEVIFRHRLPASTGYRLLGSPLRYPRTIDWEDDFTSQGLYSYHEPTPGPTSIGFQMMTNPRDTLQPGIGYYGWTPGLTLFTLKGILNEGLVSLPVSWTSDPLNRTASGWNLVGNPFACTIDWTSTQGWQRTNIMNAVYHLHPITRQYATWLNGVSTNGGKPLIAPGQAFWVRSIGTVCQLSVDERAKTRLTTHFMKSNQEQCRFALTQEPKNENIKDECVWLPTEIEGGEHAVFMPSFPNDSMPRIWIEDKDIRYSIFSSQTTSSPIIGCSMTPNLIWKIERTGCSKLQDTSILFHSVDTSQKETYFDLRSLKPLSPKTFSETISGDVVVFPNPLSLGYSLNWEFTSIQTNPVNWKLSDTMGRILAQGSALPKSGSISHEYFTQAGVYFLQFEINKQWVYFRVTLI